MDLPRSGGGPVRTARQAGQSLYALALDVVLTGIAVIVPLVVTLYVLDVAFQFIAGALNPLVKLLKWAGLISGVRQLSVVEFLLSVDIVASEVQFVTELVALLVLAAVVVTVGLVARVSHGERLIDHVDYVIASIPGIGPVYQSFRRMSDVMLSSEAENFREVRLVEFPRDGAYVLGFETARAPSAICESAGADEMVTLFLPLAPNPVMGGFLAHFPEERVLDVDLTVEEGIRSIVTSGIATDGTVATEEFEERSLLASSRETLREAAQGEIAFERWTDSSGHETADESGESGGSSEANSTDASRESTATDRQS